jgi:DNA (cytosine-5)-methyltransferase 1
VRVGALCAGYGGLELGLQLAGIDTDLVWVSETDKHASVVLDARFGVPNLGDLTEIADPPQVDAITAGFPCQPVSHAGRRAGIDDERWLIRDVVSVAERAGAQWLFLENVRGVLTANQGVAFGQVLDALADGGFDAEWACIRADQSVGACHRRERWFCVAYACGERHGGGQDGFPVGCVDGGAEGEASQRQRARQEPVDRGAAPVADAAGVGPQELRPERGLEEAGGEARRLSCFGAYEPAIRRWEQRLGRVAPPPTDEKGVSTWFVEWMMGLPSGWVCDMGLSRTQELKMLGNGVVPQQAAAAYGWLLEQTGEKA